MREYGGRKQVIWGAVLLGLGLGGLFDGIVIHQILQWHHMVSRVEPVTTVAGLRINTLGDGLFHAATYVFTVIGLLMLWAGTRGSHLTLSTKLLIGGLLVGWGAFNLVEGVIDHMLLGVHHVNETAPRNQWIWWDLGFLAWGAAMLLGGLSLMRSGDRDTTEAGARDGSALSSARA